ncbi:hypothetical protein BJ508DRAFT_211554, partial [Ascobolus immersus RN42]
MTTADWFTWTLYVSPIFFKGHLPDEHFRGYILMVRAAKLTLQKQFTDDEMDELERLWDAFSEYYEEKLYQRDFWKLNFCAPVFHAILHIAEYTRRLGPLYTSSQFPLERVI